jgi:hypothetical protein
LQIYDIASVYSNKLVFGQILLYATHCIIFASRKNTRLTA